MTTEPERPFDAPWQARTFALTVNLHEHGLFTWHEWTTTLRAALSVAPERPHYETWLEALQQMLTSREILTTNEITKTRHAWLHAAARTPHGKPIELEPS